MDVGRRFGVTLSWLAILGIGELAFARQGPGGLDPETWEEVRRSVDQKYPTLDPELKRDVLKRIEETPKVRCTIDAVTVYADGIVYRGTLASSLPDDCRLSVMGPELCLVRKARLTDKDKNEWVVPRLANRYHLERLTDVWTVLVPRGKRVRFEEVDMLESPWLVRAKPPAADTSPRPTELSYTLATYDLRYSTDLKKPKSVYLFGRGKTPVEWKAEPVPSESRPASSRTAANEPLARDRGRLEGHEETREDWCAWSHCRRVSVCSRRFRPATRTVAWARANWRSLRLGSQGV
jgi:hypothetical protein